MSHLVVDRTFGSDDTITSSQGKMLFFLDCETGFNIIPFEDLPRGTRVRLKGKIEEHHRGHFFDAHSFLILSRPLPVEQVRHQVRKTLIYSLNNRPWGGMALALLLGWRDGLEDGQEQRFRSAGASHVLALSGMHLAVLSALLLLALKRPLGLVGSAIASLIVLAFYLYLAGGQSSLVRALVMYSISVIALIRAIPAPSILVLSQSFILQMLSDPSSATTPAFMLSYFALSGILVLSGPLSNLLPAFLPPVLRSSLAASIGAFVCALPVQALFFKMAYPVGIFSSVPLAPLAGLLMILALIWLVLNALWPPLAGPFDVLSTLCYRAMNTLADRASRLPGIDLPAFTPVLIFTLCIVSAILVSNHLLSQSRRDRVLAA